MPDLWSEFDWVTIHFALLALISVKGSGRDQSPGLGLTALVAYTMVAYLSPHFWIGLPRELVALRIAFPLIAVLATLPSPTALLVCAALQLVSHGWLLARSSDHIGGHLTLAACSLLLVDDSEPDRAAGPAGALSVSLTLVVALWAFAGVVGLAGLRGVQGRCFAALHGLGLLPIPTAPPLSGAAFQRARRGAGNRNLALLPAPGTPARSMFQQ
ncbi:MAG: hypothetical protein IPM35_34110 [Myxococcales bacterium]|nr:hypothetical protein [Myxococcales bacterium]